MCRLIPRLVGGKEGGEGDTSGDLGGVDVAVRGGEVVLDAGEVGLGEQQGFGCLDVFGLDGLGQVVELGGGDVVHMYCGKEDTLDETRG